MILIALALFGIYCITLQKVEFVGDMSLPQIYVVAVWPGASAEDVEKDVVDILEEDFVTLPGFKSVSSTSMNSAGVTIITFADGINPEDRINDVRNRITELEGSLPSDLSGVPKCLIGGAEMLPVMTFAAYAGDDKKAVADYMNNTLKPRLTQIDGVSSVSIDGLTEPRLNIVLKTDELDSKGISPLVVYQILGYSNISMPLGNTNYEGKNVVARFEGSYSDIEEIKNLPVGSGDDGTIIRLKDVADVSLDNTESDYYITSGGEDVIVVSLCKRKGDGNAVKIANAVMKILDESEKETSGAIKYKVISEDKSTVTNSMSTVITSGILGVLIAVVIIFLFLNDIRATLVIALSIPLSIFFTFIVMKLMGITINLFSISGIVVALGSIVDASIVVIDEIYRSYQKLDESGNALYSVTESIDRGSDKVGMSVVGSNLTTVVVFIPIALLSGIVGMILKDLSVTFMASILSSLIVAIVFVPWLMKIFMKEDSSKRQAKKESFVVKGVNKLEKVYGKAVGGVLKDPLTIFIVAIGLLALTVFILPHLSMAFLPSTDNGDFYINVSFPYGYNKDETKEGMEKIENIMLDYLDEGTVKTYVVYSGKESGSGISFTNSENEGGIHAVLVPVNKRNYNLHDAITDLQKIISEKVPDATISVTNGGFDRLVGFISGSGFGIELIGDDTEELYDECVKIRDFLLTDDEIMTSEINATYSNLSSVMNANYDNLSSLGFTSYEAAMTTAILFNGMDIGRFTDSVTGDKYDIHLSSDVKDYPLDESLMASLKLKGQAGTTSLTSLADIRTEAELSEIHHENRAKSMTVTATMTGESTTGIQRRFDEWLLDNPLPDGITIKKSGLGELLSDSIPPLVSALAIAIFLVYFVMVMVFERYNQPLQIMATVPFCLVGVGLSLLLFNSTLNLVSILGLVSLMGMLVNNGIILCDSINYLNREWRIEKLTKLGFKTDDMTEKEMYGRLSLEEEKDVLFSHVKEGAVSRLRPILMSSLTTILGVIPMAFAFGEGSEIYAPLGQVIMGGLATSMLITLFITPVIYYLFEKSRINRAYKRRAKKDKNEENSISLT